jgi:hypothetical protein
MSDITGIVPVAIGSPKGFLQDSNGDNSSKRLWGSLSMVLGLAMKVSFAIFALTPWIAIADVAVRIPVALGAADGILMAGAALLGFGVLEGLKIGKQA